MVICSFFSVYIIFHRRLKVKGEKEAQFCSQGGIPGDWGGLGVPSLTSLHTPLQAVLPVSWRWPAKVMLAWQGVYVGAVLRRPGREEARLRWRPSASPVGSVGLNGPVQLPHVSWRSRGRALCPARTAFQIWLMGINCTFRFSADIQDLFFHR